MDIYHFILAPFPCLFNVSCRNVFLLQLIDSSIYKFKAYVKKMSMNVCALNSYVKLMIKNRQDPAISFLHFFVLYDTSYTNTYECKHACFLFIQTIQPCSFSSFKKWYTMLFSTPPLFHGTRDSKTVCDHIKNSTGQRPDECL